MDLSHAEVHPKSLHIFFQRLRAHFGLKLKRTDPQALSSFHSSNAMIGLTLTGFLVLSGLVTLAHMSSAWP